MVSICCITYNQVDYVADMLDSIFSQNTSFDFEVLLHDDASNDGTVEILREYESKYSNFRVFYEADNRWGSGINYINEILLPNALGDYIAICEGDDYWISSDKLERQVSFMASHPECKLSTSAGLVLDEKDSSNGIMGLGSEDRYISAFELAREWHLPTASFLFRREDALLYAHSWTFRMPVGDFPRAFYLATKGYVHYFAEPLTVYRFGSAGSWTKANNANAQKLISNGIDWLDMLEKIDAATDGLFHAALVDNAKTKAIRLVARLGKSCLSGIGCEAYQELTFKQKLICIVLRVMWLCGFDLQRTAWSGSSQWRLARRP